jgi:hypothetical protein
VRVNSFLLAMTVGLAVIVTACDDKATNPNANDLARLWPDDEGRRWSYAGHLAAWRADLYDSAYVFPQPEDVPDIPAWETILAYLDAPPSPSMIFHGESYTYDLRFQGTLNLTHRVRNLQETYDGEDFMTCGPGPNDSTSAPHLYQTLGAVSPDLLERVRSVHQSASGLVIRAHLIHGGAFERTDHWVGTYGCADSTLEWKFLTADLRPGATFTHQPVASLRDVFLHGRVRGPTTIDTQAGHFEALEVDYAIDYGVWGDPGNPLYGYGRVLLLGQVFYVTDVGPVASIEWDVVPVGMNGLGVGSARITLDLTGTSTP